MIYFNRETCLTVFSEQYMTCHTFLHWIFTCIFRCWIWILSRLDEMFKNLGHVWINHFLLITFNSCYHIHYNSSHNWFQLLLWYWTFDYVVNFGEESGFGQKTMLSIRWRWSIIACVSVCHSYTTVSDAIATSPQCLDNGQCRPVRKSSGRGL